MTHFLNNGSRFDAVDSKDISLFTKLPAGTFIVKEDPRTELLYLQYVESPTIPEKVYGDTEWYANRVLRTYADRKGNTGVLLVGEKGSGKTLLAKMLSVKAARFNIPTIIINEPFHGDAFNKFLQDINQPTVVLFDEFEKVYDYDDQEKILTVLDGVFNSRKLFVLTCNDPHLIDQHFKNRPGRIFYTKEFTGLSDEAIAEYCLDKKVSPEAMGSILKISKAFSDFNFDMLAAIVEETARFKETPEESLKYLNFAPEGTASYAVSVFVKGVRLSPENQQPTVYSSHPLVNGIINISYLTGNPPADPSELPETINNDSLYSKGTRIRRKSRSLQDYLDEDELQLEEDPSSDKPRRVLKVKTTNPVILSDGALAFDYDSETRIVFTKIKDTTVNWDAF